MIEQTIGFYFKGHHHEWELVHNLDEHNIELKDMFLSFKEKCLDKVDDIDMFCGFIMSEAKKSSIELFCVPKKIFHKHNKDN